MRKFKFIAATAALFTVLTSMAFADNDCKTHEICPVGSTCECFIIPCGASDRYFYFDLTAMQKKHNYQCHIQASRSSLSVIMGASVFPAGTKVKCEGSCTQFPVNLSMDTNEMKDQTATAIVKYFVPASDTPNNVRVECKN